MPHFKWWTAVLSKEKDCTGCLFRAYKCPIRIVLCPTWHSTGGNGNCIWKVCILFYDWTSTPTDIDQARRKCFAKRHNVPSILSTKAALKEHVERPVYQGGHVWGQMLVSTPELPSPCRWGWSKASEGHYELFWTCLPDAGQSSYELASCKCKKGGVESLPWLTPCLDSYYCQLGLSCIVSFQIG